MSKNIVTRTQKAKREGRTDARVRRTHEQLGRAMVELIRDQAIDNITVQDVLDRARVGRSTFYLHFRDKNDLLFTQLEHFLEHMSNVLTVREEPARRIVAVKEILEHVGHENRIFRALADAGQLDDFFALAQGYFARSIEQRLKESRRVANLPQRELKVRSVALAGSFLSLMRWWIEQSAKETPEELDKMFHRMVWQGMT